MRKEKYKKNNTNKEEQEIRVIKNIKDISNFSLRQLKMNELLKRIIAEFIIDKIYFEGDLISISKVEISKDFSSCKIYFSNIKLENSKEILNRLKNLESSISLYLFKDLSLKKPIKCYFQEMNELKFNF